jgi:hypothetical protein
MRSTGAKQTWQKERDVDYLKIESRGSVNSGKGGHGIELTPDEALGCHAAMVAMIRAICARGDKAPLFAEIKRACDEHYQQ